MYTLDWILPVVIAAVFIMMMSRLREPTRRRFNAIFVAGAGAAYLSGGFGPWEVPFTAIMTWLAFRGLDDYRFIAAAWLCHTVWDVAHHLWGNPIVPFQATSSAGCAITDALIALWFWRDAPAVFVAQAPPTAAASAAD
jgi:hypothetical protein